MQYKNLEKNKKRCLCGDIMEFIGWNDKGLIYKCSCGRKDILLEENISNLDIKNNIIPAYI